jgi:LysR family carnitine catabolism transcriptional activator
VAVADGTWLDRPRLLSIHVAEIASFVALVDHDGFTHAARAMNLSQAAFSARIARLELALGVTLVDRTVKRLTLTREGRAFQPLARSLLVMLGAVAESVDSHRAGA